MSDSYKLNGSGYKLPSKVTIEPDINYMNTTIFDNIKITKRYSDIFKDIDTLTPFENKRVKVGSDGYLYLEDPEDSKLNENSSQSPSKVDIFSSKEFDDLKHNLKKSPKEVLSNDDFLKVLKEVMLNILIADMSGNRDIVSLCIHKVLSTYTGIDVNGAFCLIGTDVEHIKNTLRENAKEFFLGDKEFYRSLTRILVMCGIYYPLISPYISEVMDEFASITKNRILKEI